MCKKVLILVLAILLIDFGKLPFLYAQTDDIVQEYTDHNIKEPAESDFVTTYEDELDYFNDSELNKGEYEEFLVNEEFWDYMDNLRTVLNEPIALSSTYRNPDKNDSVGGAWNSIHQYGGASDVTSVGGSAWSEMDSAEREDLLWAVNYTADLMGLDIDVDPNYDNHLHIELGTYCDYPD